MSIVYHARKSIGYPQKFESLRHNAPLGIYRLGPAWDESTKSVAVVGARRASELGRRFTQELSRYLSCHNIRVISGGALGIDRFAHLGVVEQNMPTCAVLPTPLNKLAPRSNRKLFHSILDCGGTLLSEHKDVVTRANFATRNRLIAALSDVVIVIEAGLHSGTHHTMAWALRLKKPVFGKYWPVGDFRGEGLHSWQSKGLQFFQTAEEILKWFDQPKEQLHLAFGESIYPKNSIHSRLLEKLTKPCSIDRLVVDLGISINELLLCISELEIDGAVICSAGMVRKVDSIFQKSEM